MLLLLGALGRLPLRLLSGRELWVQHSPGFYIYTPLYAPLNKTGDFILTEVAVPKKNHLIYITHYIKKMSRSNNRFYDLPEDLQTKIMTDRAKGVLRRVLNAQRANPSALCNAPINTMTKAQIIRCLLKKHKYTASSLNIDFPTLLRTLTTEQVERFLNILTKEQRHDLLDDIHGGGMYDLYGKPYPRDYIRRHVFRFLEENGYDANTAARVTFPNQSPRTREVMIQARRDYIRGMRM